MSDPTRNTPPGKWPRIFTAEFTNPAKTGKEATEKFMVGKTWGATGDNSIVHSIREQMEGDTLCYYVYYNEVGSEEEKLWRMFSGFITTLTYDTLGRITRYEE